MGLVERVTGILLAPGETWPRIAAEPATVQSIYTGHVLLLAAIGPVAMVIRYADLGFPWALRLALATYVVTLVMTFVLAMIVDVIAPSFGGQKDFVAALKLVAYSGTAVFLAGILHLIGWIAQVLMWIAAIYALYTFYLGAAVMKKCTTDRAIPFTLILAVGVLALYFVAAAATGVRRF